MSLPNRQAAEVISRKKTSDGIIVELWSDGSLTTGMAVIVGQAARTAEQLRLYLAAGWLVMGDVEIHDASEIKDLLLAARWAAKRGLGPGEMRQRLYQTPNLKPIWTTLETDRSGRPILQCWVLPRLRWPGLSVWKEKGKYSICQETSHKSGTYSPTGFEFRNLAELTRHLQDDVKEV